MLNLGYHAEAAGVVAQVPTTYTYNVAFNASTLWTQNAVNQLLNGEKRWSVALRKGSNGLAWDDPRTPWEGPFYDAASAEIAPYRQAKYPTLGSAIPLATGIEARLIEAEAALRSGDRADFVASHDAARAAAGLPPLNAGTVAGLTEGQLVDLHFQERAYHLWLTAPGWAT
jgi:starch-binding outer membrane protein, SusD/RagB family